MGFIYTSLCADYFSRCLLYYLITFIDAIVYYLLLLYLVVSRDYLQKIMKCYFVQTVRQI